MDIKALKDKILQLAIQGKLVEQNPGDEPVLVFLEKIKEEKEKIISNKRIKKEKQFSYIYDEEKFIKLPYGWQWARIGDLFNVVRGSSPRPKGHPKYFTDTKTEYNWVTIKDITQFCKNNILSKTTEYLTYEGSLKSRAIEKGEIIIAVSGSIGKTAIMGIDGYIYDGLAGFKQVVKSEELRDYVYLFLSSWRDKLNKMSEGTSIQNINTEKLNSLVIPLPPLEEQKRIVSKVDELFNLIDELDNNKQELLKNIADSRYKILQLAIQGKLVEQNEEDEPSSILLEKIAEKKERLVKEKKINKEKPLQEISEEEKPFKLSNGWEWVRWSDILALGEGSMRRGPFGSALTKNIFIPKGENAYKVYEQKNAIYDDSTLGEYYITKEKFEELQTFEVNAGDLIISCSGVTLGRISQIPDKYHKGIINQALLRIRLNDNLINKDYFIKFFKSKYFQEKIFDRAKGSAIPNMVGVKVLRNFLIPLPPLQEQKRIVEKVDMLMDYLDTLQEEI